MAKDKAALGVLFNTPPKEAVNYFDSKIAVDTYGWRDVWEGAHETSFVVAGATKGDVLLDVQEQLSEALKNGVPYEKFKKDIEKTFIRRGWKQDTGGVPPWRIKTIYQTNILGAYAAGREERQQEVTKAFPIWVYKAISDARSRPDHLKLHNKAVRFNDPFWATHTPLNGYNCRCSKVAMNEKQAARRGLIVESPKIEKTETEINKTTGESVPTTRATFKNGVSMKPDPSFNHSPLAAWKPDPSKYPPKIAKQVKKDVKAAPKKAKIVAAQDIGKTQEQAQRLEWQPIKNAKEGVEQLKQVIDGEIKLGRMRPELINEVGDELFSLSNEYGKNILKGLKTESTDSIAYVGRPLKYVGSDAAKVIEKPSLTLSSKYFSSQSLNDHAKKYEYSKKTRFFGQVEAKNTARSTIRHEFFHALAETDSTGFDTFIDTNDGYKKNVTPIIKTSKDVFEQIKEVRGRYVKELEKIKQDRLKIEGSKKSAAAKAKALEENEALEKKVFISKYAREDLDEFGAESFSLSIYDQNPSPYAVEVKEIVEKIFKKGAN